MCLPIGDRGGERPSFHIFRVQLLSAVRVPRLQTSLAAIARRIRKTLAEADSSGNPGALPMPPELASGLISTGIAQSPAALLSLGEWTDEAQDAQLI